MGIKTLFEFGKKQVKLGFIKNFEKIEENGKIFAHFEFHQHTRPRTKKQ